MNPAGMTFDIQIVLPILFVAVYALIVLLVTPAFRGDGKYLGWVSLGGLAVAAWSAYSLWGSSGQTAGGLVLLDGFSLFFDALFLVIGAIAILASIPYLEREQAHHGEYYALVLLSLTGMMTMVSSENLLMIFLGLELLSIPLYVLSGFTRTRVRAIESSLKYFLLGAFSTGLMLYGIAFTYGATGSLELRAIARALAGGTASHATFALGVGLVLVGFCFKIAAVPFHAWVPDVYQGAPGPVVALMAAGTKAAALGALMRVVYTALPRIAHGAAAAAGSLDWHRVLVILAVLSMTGGNLIAIAQKNIKRMLAYSSIAHVGYLLIALVTPAESGVQAIAFYLVSYSLMTMGAFVVATIVGRSGGEGEEGYTLSSYAGLGSRRPFLALAMTVFLLSLTGIPPTGGFVAKLAIFRAAIDSRMYLLAAIGVVNSAIGAYYYLGPVVSMWMRPAGEGTRPALAHVATSVSITASVVGTLVLGVYPAPLLELARELYISLI